MPTPNTDKSDIAGKTTATGGQTGAIELLKQDHREVKQLFKTFQSQTDEDAQAKLAEQICTALKVHTQLEEELF